LKAQGTDDPFYAVSPFFEPGAQLRKVNHALLGAFAPCGIAAIFQVLAGVVVVDDFDGRLGWRR
jgi:hypothetical protein